MSETLWEVYALKYSERNSRTRFDSFLFDPHHNVAHDMDYFVWVLRSGDEIILVDTGYMTQVKQNSVAGQFCVPRQKRWRHCLLRQTR